MTDKKKLRNFEISEIIEDFNAHPIAILSFVISYFNTLTSWCSKPLGIESFEVWDPRHVWAYAERNPGS